MDVSIILVSYNTKDLTRECIKSIYEKTHGISYDIWVIDNASSDGSVEMLREEFPEVKLIASEVNHGFGKANNIAIKESQGKYVFLLNTDTILLNNAVKILFDFMEESPEIGACGGQLFNADMTYQMGYGEFNNLEKLRRKAYGINFSVIKHRLNRKFAQKVLKSKNYIYDTTTKSKEVDYIIGADMMLKREALDKAGLFNEVIFMYGEEMELQFRIKKNGYNIKFNPEAKILHYGGGSTTDENKKLKIEKLMLEGNTKFFKYAYGEKEYQQAKILYLIYYLRYLVLRPFSHKSYKRLNLIIDLFRQKN